MAQRQHYFFNLSDELFKTLLYQQIWSSDNNLKPFTHHASTLLLSSYEKRMRAQGETKERPERSRWTLPSTPPLPYLRCVSLDLYAGSLLSALIFVNMKFLKLFIDFINEAISLAKNLSAFYGYSQVPII